MDPTKTSLRHRISSPRRQRGVAIVLFTIALVAMLGLVGLALDGAHSMLDKTRLQNTVDAAALSAAKTLDVSVGDQTLATVEALAMFSANAADAGNDEIAAAYAGGQLSVSVEFSSLLHPFTPGTAPARYVRVTATNLIVPGWFTPVLGIDETIVGATAVSGPSPSINTGCNLAPMMVCGDPAAPPDENFGYELGVADVLKASTDSFEVGAGNFQLIRLGGGQGGAVVREAMAGGYAGCLTSGDSIPTEPGNTVGPVVQGINTRFGIYSGPMNGTESTYPPDVVVAEPSAPLSYECPKAGADSDTICYQNEPLPADPADYEFYDYDNYITDIGHSNYDYDPIEDGGTGAHNRRILAVPVGDCTNTTNGQGDVPVLGFLCYHLIQKAIQKGNESQLFGQFLGTGCPITGRPGPAPGTGPGPYIIQLYKDERTDAS